MRTDEELAFLAASEEDAFKELVERYEKRIYTMTLRYCGHPDDAFDLSQEVFLKVWRGLGKFRGDASFSTWLYRLTQNVCMDFSRRNKHKKTVSLETPEGAPAWELPDERFEPAHRQESRQLQEDITKALDYLSPDYRSILLLREVSGLSYAEIAAVLSLEEGTVKSRLSRARMRLREVLQNIWNEAGPIASNKKKRP